MRIYHYTSIDTLALIIQNKKIRFNRLDFVDDCEESLYGSGPTKIKLGQYTFVSCWTKFFEENLALWKMYTNYKGVRIGMDKDMFITYQLNENLQSYFDGITTIRGNALISAYLNNVKLHDVTYVQDIESEMGNLVEQVGETGVWIKTDKMGLFKRKEWAIQNECRFKINVQPIQPAILDRLKNTNDLQLCSLIGTLGPTIAANTPVNINYLDIQLKEDKLDSIEVMMGPMTTEGERIIVEHLLAKFSNATVVDSYFKGKIRK